VTSHPPHLPLCHPAACWPGFGGSGCGACHPGTAKNVVGTKECSFCLDGFVANAQSGATDCLDAAATEEGTKEEACERNEIEGMTVYDEKINACKCEEGLVFTLNSGGDPSCEEPTPTAPSGSTPSGSGSPSGGSPGGKDKDEDDKPNKHGKVGSSGFVLTLDPDTCVPAKVLHTPVIHS
jgi:hypothetical protein